LSGLDKRPGLADTKYTMVIGVIIAILLFIIGSVLIYLFSLIAETTVGRWFLLNSIACFIAGLVLLYIFIW
jgi:hypothetical protein